VVTSHVYRMCGHLESPFAFVSHATNTTVKFHSDNVHQASGFSIGYVTYSGIYLHDITHQPVVFLYKPVYESARALLSMTS